MFIVNNRNTRTRCETYFTPCSNVSIVNFEQVNFDTQNFNTTFITCARYLEYYYEHSQLYVFTFFEK